MGAASSSGAVTAGCAALVDSGAAAALRPLGTSLPLSFPTDGDVDASTALAGLCSVVLEAAHPGSRVSGHGGTVLASEGPPALGSAGLPSSQRTSGMEASQGAGAPDVVDVFVAVAAAVVAATSAAGAAAARRLATLPVLGVPSRSREVRGARGTGRSRGTPAWTLVRRAASTLAPRAGQGAGEKLGSQGVDVCGKACSQQKNRKGLSLAHPFIPV